MPRVCRPLPAAIAATVSVLAVLLAAPAACELRAPDGLRCEYMTNPVGIDVASPRFAWEIRDDRRGAVQSAYQILVATAQAGNPVWDSGRVASDQSIQVPYAGPWLASCTRYYWKVRTWDADGEVSPYSEASLFETALLSPDDWTAQWISPAAEVADERTVPMGDWIWHPGLLGDKQEAFFRADITLDSDEEVAFAAIRCTADNVYQLFLNGQEIGKDGNFNSVEQYDVRDVLRSGANAIAVKAANASGPCGLAFGMRVIHTDGQAVDLVSGLDWRTGTEGPDGWRQAGTNDSAWVKPNVVAKYGEGPWGTLGNESPDRSQCLRREFEVAGKVRRARAYVSGLGLYQLRINGQVVGADTLTPGWTHYHKRVQYQTYDVTDLLNEGANAAGALLGTGWWGANMAGKWKEGRSRFILQLDIECASGKRQRVVTDDSWKAHPSPILENTLYHGETHDARLELPGWDRPGFDDAPWNATVADTEYAANLVAQYCPTIQVTGELKPVKMTRLPDGETIADFGQNHSGRIRIAVQGEQGDRVRIRHAEVLNADGTLYTDNYRSARVTDVYILKGDGEEVWEPAFTYRGFRYAEVTGYPGGTVPADAIVSRVVNTALPEAGTFACSSDLINQIQHNLLWGLRSNVHSVPTDCPQRDERLGWTGDAQAFAPTATWNRDLATFWTKWLRDLRDSARDDGSITDIAPAMRDKPAAPGWGDVITILPWTAYQFYGDTRIIEENYASMRAWVEYMRGQAENGLLYKVERYGDWVAPVASPKHPIASAYYYYSTELLSRMARAIGRTDDAVRYRELAAKIAEAFNAEYLDDTNNYPEGTQTGNLLPLFFGITPEARRDAVFANVVENIGSRGDHLSTGFLGTACLMPVLSGMGGHDVACRLALQRTYPSWGYMVDNGATTIWERWNGNRIEEVGAGMNSFNHFCFGVVGEWFYQSLAGINPDPEMPGFKHTIIRPRPGAGLTWAKAEYRSVHGLIRSSWKIDNAGLALDVVIPANTSATIHVPATDAAAVTEGGVPAAQAPGLDYVAVVDGFAVYRAGAGAYGFLSKGYTVR
jgi:alpha-L-rhamnosidase